MNRRELFYSLLGVSCLPAFTEAQQTTRASTANGPNDVTSTLKLTPIDVVADGTIRFFRNGEFQTFRRFADLMMPEAENEPGALTAKAPEFLDFLLSESPAEIQTLYRNGVRELDRKSAGRYGRPFSKLTDADVVLLLAPLAEPWIYKGPSDPYAQFLQAGKLAVWQATVNSREWSEAQSGRRRGAAGMNTFYLPVE